MYFISYTFFSCLDLFLPFKTPFDNTNILEEEQFTGQQFINLVKAEEVWLLITETIFNLNI